MNETTISAGFEEIVRARAYARWESEGRPFGRDAEHWRLSEEETRRELVSPAATVAKPKTKATPQKKAAPKRRVAFGEATLSA
jgi:hypothetical protein